jgi:hypothetical protein
MTGQELYEIWAHRMNYLGTEVDRWIALEETDRMAWNFLAKEVAS